MGCVLVFIFYQMLEVKVGECYFATLWIWNTTQVELTARCKGVTGSGARPFPESLIHTFCFFRFTILGVISWVVLRAMKKIHYPRIVKICSLNYVAPLWCLIFSPSVQTAGVSTGPVRDCGKPGRKNCWCLQKSGDFMHLQQQQCAPLLHIRSRRCITVDISCCCRTELLTDLL